MTNLVAIVRVEESNIQEGLWKAIDLVGGFNPAKGSKVVIKPNLCTARKNSDSGVTVDVRIVEALIQYIQAKTKCEIVIAEADSDRSADEAFRRLGYKELEAKYGVKLVNLSKDNIYKLILNGKKLSVLEIPETLLLADYLISVAKIKRHVHERFTGIWKNQYGLIPDKSTRVTLHPFLSEVLYDLNTICTPDIAILEGLVGLEGPGPIEGYPKHIGKIICSKNPLSADVVACKLIGERPIKIPSIKYAIKHGWKDATDIMIIGDVDEFNVELNFISSFNYYLYRIGLWLRRIGHYLTNIGRLTAYMSYALRSFTATELMEGKILPPITMLKIAKQTVFKIEACQKITD